ncbi:MAG: TIGR02147 family protein [Bdellovibrionaceae bacterium]|nr:TIGR02147 family protein [Bdellovibrionales bacterium]MCB9085938.1 TIGR02147 family protein [Pseudobdellovibrionaceae bacterium]
MNEFVRRPIISEFEDPVEYLREMLEYRRQAEPSFSVSRASQPLRRVSSTLVSLILRGRRRITLDRTDEFAQLMDLSSSEKFYFKNWIENKETHPSPPHESSDGGVHRQRKNVSTSLLNDWINVYVKDLFQLPKIRENPDLIFQQLATVASISRIEKSLKFLLREGYLRRTMNGRIELETNLAVADPRVPSSKIRRFHKGALKLAQLAIDLFPPSERLANTLTIPLNDESYAELMKIIDQFAENLKDFAAKNEQEGDRLYQLILNVSPVGGKLK